MRRSDCTASSSGIISELRMNWEYPAVQLHWDRHYRILAVAIRSLFLTYPTEARTRRKPDFILSLSLSLSVSLSLPLPHTHTHTTHTHTTHTTHTHTHTHTRARARVTAVLECGQFALLGGDISPKTFPVSAWSTAWVSGFESRCVHGCLSIVNVVYVVR